MARYAITVPTPAGEPIRLACPEVPRYLPRDVRVRIYELVLLRQIGHADTLLQIEEDVRQGAGQYAAEVHSLIAARWTTSDHVEVRRMAA